MTAKPGITGMGTATVKYNGNTAAPFNTGTYTVTFDVAEGTNYTAANNNWSAGTLSIYFASVATLGTWLSSQPANTAATAYAVTLNVNNLEGDASTSGSIGYVLRNNSAKYVNLDLSVSTITNIPVRAFYVSSTDTGCATLVGITIPDSVTSIGGNAFYQCTSLTAIEVDSANSAYSSEYGVLYNKDKTTLIRYPQGKAGSTFIIPNSVTSIDQFAFSGCTSLTSVTITAGVTSIGLYAFYQCTGLTSVTIPNSVTSIGNRAFSNCSRLSSVTFEGTISSSGFNYSAFSDIGDLYDKFYATNATNGTPGTYKTTAPVSDSSVWTKQ